MLSPLPSGCTRSSFSALGRRRWRALGAIGFALGLSAPLCPPLSAQPAPTAHGAVDFNAERKVVGRAFLGVNGVADGTAVDWSLVVSTQPIEHPGETVPGLHFEHYQGSGNLGNINSFRNYFAANEPTARSQEATIAWGGFLGEINPSTGQNFPAYFDSVQKELGPVGANALDGYGARMTGEILIPESGTYKFRDGVDDFCYFAIDGDALINDNGWTGADGTRGAGRPGQGSPIVTRTYTNIPEGGQWFTVEFVMGEGGGGDRGFIFWDYDTTAPEGSRLGAATGFSTDIDDPIAAPVPVIPIENFRAVPPISHLRVVVGALAGTGRVGAGAGLEVFADAAGDCITLGPLDGFIYHYELTVTGGGTSTTFEGFFQAARDDAFATDEVTEVRGNILGNDAGALRVASSDLTGVLGDLVLNLDGSFVYRPNGVFDTLVPGEVVEETFTYSIDPPHPFGINEGTVTITVNGINSPPVAGADPDVGEVGEGGGTVTLGRADLLANDSDPEGEALLIAGAEPAGSLGGRVTVTSDVPIEPGLIGRYYDLPGQGGTALLDGPGEAIGLDAIAPTVVQVTHWIDFGAGTDNTPGTGGTLDRGGSNGNVFGGIGVSVPNDDHAAAWEGYLIIPKDGTYRITTRSDDGSRAWLDTDGDGTLELVVENNGLHGMRNRTSADLLLAAGPYRFKAAFFERGGGSGMQVSWEQVGGFGREIIPPSAFLTDLLQITYEAAGNLEFLSGGEVGEDVISYQVADASGGVATGLATVRVIGENDRPVVDPAGNPRLNPVPVDIDPADNPGTRVAAIVESAGGAISDVDRNDELGIAVIATNTNGTWQYRRAGGATWTDVGAVSVEVPLLLGPQDWLRFQPNPGYVSTPGAEPSVTFRAWDGGAGIYRQNFAFPDGATDLGDGSEIGGNDGTASVQGGALRLSQDGVGDTRSSFLVPPVLGSSTGWKASFNVTLIDSGDGQRAADGFSFNYGPLAHARGLLTEHYQNSNVGGNLNELRDYFAANEPTVPVFVAPGIFWGGLNSEVNPATGMNFQRYYPEVSAVLPGGHDNYSVRMSGELFIPESGTYRFKDGNDDYTYLSVDGEELINDNNWTGVLGAPQNGSSPIVSKTFTGVPLGGMWVPFEFFMDEGGGGDSGFLYWDYDHTAPPGARLGAAPGFPTARTQPVGLPRPVIFPAFFRTAPLTDVQRHGLGERGFGRGLSVEFDTWDNGGGENGFNVGVDGADVPGGFVPDEILPEGSVVNASVCVTWHPSDGLTLVVDRGAGPETIFQNLATPGFVGSEGYGFGFSARTGGATETVLIDDLVIETNGALSLETDTATVEVSGEVSDLSIRHFTSVDFLEAGSTRQNLFLLVAVTNRGPTPATGVEVALDLTLPAGVRVAYTLPQGVGSRWLVGNLRVGETKILNIQLQVAASAAAGENVISSTASVARASSALFRTGDDSATVTASIVAAPVRNSADDAGSALGQVLMAAFPDDFGDPASRSTVWGPRADPDEDGIPNFVEFAFGSDPNDRDSTPDNTVLVVDDGGMFLELTFNRLLSGNGFVYIVEYSLDMVTWTGGFDFLRQQGTVPGAPAGYERVVFRPAVSIPVDGMQAVRVRVQLFQNRN